MAKTSRTTKYPPMAAGQRFGRLVAVEFVDIVGHRIPRWKFQCDCGEHRVTAIYDVLRGASCSCGCKKKEYLGRKPTHGMRYTPEYSSWRAMIQRCTNPNSSYYADYGGRGIHVYEPWLGSFEAFYAYIGPRPSLAHTIDRYPDENGDYQPENVRWATKKQQARNRRNTRMVVFNGSTMTLALACELSGKCLNTVASRLDRGWPSDRAFA